MPADLATTNGRPAMMYAGEPPWHSLGTRLDAPATAEEAIAAAGLDYEVTLTPVATVDGLDVPKTRAVVRYDTQAVLGVVSDRYVPVQNRQAFGFLDAVVAEGGLRYHTAGALGQGERVWLLARLPDQIRVRGGDDLVDKYLLLSNAHDGSAALRVFFTPVRVVCANTLSLAHRQAAGEGVSILHKGDLRAKIGHAQQVLGLAQRFFDDAAAVIDRLAGYSPTSDQLAAYFRDLYPDPDGGKDNARAVKARAELQRLFEEGVGHDRPGVRGTAWAAYNAVTEYVDHHRPARGPGDPDRSSRRLDSIWFGSGARRKAAAWDLAQVLAGVN
jgi:phage/plasmid-like protein (TIGR03299 family)